MSGLLRHMCHLESATNIVSRRPGTCRYWYYNIRNILYKLVLNFYLKFSSSKSPFCSGLAHPANHAVWHGPGPRLSELAFFRLKNRKYTHFFKICVLATFSLRRVGRPYGYYGRSNCSCAASFLKRTNPGSEGPKSDWKVLF